MAVEEGGGGKPASCGCGKVEGVCGSVVRRKKEAIAV